MKRRRILLILLGCVASIVLAVLVWPREREPEYYGVPLTGCLARCNSSSITEAESAGEIIRQNATSALPFLVRWIQHETPGWRKLLERVASKLPSVVADSRRVQWLLDDKSEVRANSAIGGFEALGPRAEPALPTLQRLAESAKRPQTSFRAWICIAHIDPTRAPQVALPRSE